jgi:hypothetical protein
MEDELGIICSTHEIENKWIAILVGVSEGRILLGRPKSRLELDVKMNFKEIRWNCVDSVHLAQKSDQRRVLLRTVINFRVIKISRNVMNY